MCSLPLWLCSSPLAIYAYLKFSWNHLSYLLENSGRKESWKGGRGIHNTRKSSQVSGHLHPGGGRLFHVKRWGNCLGCNLKNIPTFPLSQFLPLLHWDGDGYLLPLGCEEDLKRSLCQMLWIIPGMQKVLHKEEEFMPYWMADLEKLSKSLNPVSSSVERATSRMSADDK